MCGIAGVARRDPAGVAPEILSAMAAAIRHRGPDGFGYYAGSRVGLASVRLSIIDVAGGAQPITNEDGRLVVVYNGEIFNYVELRRELEALGHRFRTRTDTEVIVHAYEAWGERMFDRFNGQFAFALYDRRNESVILARDRFGVRPLYYALRDGGLWFGSEIKALLAGGEVDAVPDYHGIDEVFTFWATRPPRTGFAGVQSLEPGSYAVWRDGRLSVRYYYRLGNGAQAGTAEAPDALERLDELLCSAVQLRLRADVPVGGYLSGGLDSSIVCALAARASSHAVRTFSVTFDDALLDESAFQQHIARQIESLHAVQRIGGDEVARAFPDVVWHAESPLVRTAPAPMLLLARLARQRGIKVVLTGEGSDELFLGYDLFKEALVREFCLRHADSKWRPRLFDRLYPYLAGSGRGRGGDFWRRFFLTAGEPGDTLFSHLPRFLLTSRIKEFYSDRTRAELADWDPLRELRDTLPQGFAEWPLLGRAAYLEMKTLLSPYLLSHQGDRMAMAHGVEGRFPFLDHRLYEFAMALPARSKLRVTHMREKDILRRWSRGVVPTQVIDRPKQPYRAPDSRSFFGVDAPDYVEELLDPAVVDRVGVFDGRAVSGLVQRCRSGAAQGVRENQALVAILSTQLWWRRFIDPPKTGAAYSLSLQSADVALQDETGILA